MKKRVRFPARPLSTKTYNTLVPILTKKGVFFFRWEARIREIKKTVTFRAWVRQILKMGKIVHVFHMPKSLYINVFEL